VVGDFDWTKYALNKMGIKLPTPPDYPKCLKHLLNRKIWETTAGEMEEFLKTVGDKETYFIKPS